MNDSERSYFSLPPPDRVPALPELRLQIGASLRAGMADYALRAITLPHPEIIAVLRALQAQLPARDASVAAYQVPAPRPAAGRHLADESAHDRYFHVCRISNPKSTDFVHGAVMAASVFHTAMSADYGPADARRFEAVGLGLAALLGEIGAGVTHETRNLMSAILGFAQVGKQRTDDPDSARRYFEMIEREAMRCVEILDRFLQFGRIDGGDVEDVDVGKVVQQVANATNHQMTMQRIRLNVVLAELPIVRGRRGALQQVVLNLVINAMHATPSGGDVTLTTARVAEGIEIAVADTGAGVPVELRERVFEPFFTTKANGEGTGLGLALCKRIVEAHGGTIEAGGEVGHGARFVVRLPV